MIRTLFFAATLTLSVAAESLAEPLYLNTGTRDPYTTQEHQGFLDLVIKEVFTRVGRDAEVSVYQASKRALANANEGVDDGAAMRVKGLDKKFPNLIRVPEVLLQNDFIAVGTRDDLTIEGFADLENLAISYILGWQIFQNNLKDHAHTTHAKDPQQMFTLLQRDRADVILYERWQGLWRAHDLGLEVTAHEPPLASVDMFIYVHKKHADLVEPLAQALRDMKADGSYQAIVERTLSPLAKKD